MPILFIAIGGFLLWAVIFGKLTPLYNAIFATQPAP